MLYHLSQAEGQTRSLRDMTSVKVAQILEERGWTQKEAARYLGVSQPRISDLRRGKTHKFTLDTLVEMLFALGRPVTLQVDEAIGWDLSTHLETPADYEAAVAYYTRAIRLDPRHAQAYARRANAHSALQHHEEAIADYARCIELDPDRPGYRSNLVWVLRAAGQLQAALQASEDLLRLFPDEDVYANRGLVYAALGDHTAAIADYGRSIEMDGERSGPYWNRALSYEAVGRLTDALADHEKVIQLDPTYLRSIEAASRIRSALAQ